jgi:hypothetical protein
VRLDVPVVERTDVEDSTSRCWELTRRTASSFHPSLSTIEMTSSSSSSETKRDPTPSLPALGSQTSPRSRCYPSRPVAQPLRLPAPPRRRPPRSGDRPRHAEEGEVKRVAAPKRTETSDERSSSFHREYGRCVEMRCVVPASLSVALSLSLSAMTRSSIKRRVLPTRAIRRPTRPR